MYCSDCLYYTDLGACRHPKVSKQDHGYFESACEHFHLSQPDNKDEDNMKPVTKPETKTCTVCGRELPLDQFSKNRWGYTSICSDCMKEKKSAGLKSRGKESAPVSDVSDVSTVSQPTHEEPAPMPLEYFTDDDIFLELTRRGWSGKLSRIETREIEPNANK